MNFNEFINEKKLYILKRRFRIADLLNSNIYDINNIQKWMELYSFDKMALAMLVSKENFNKENKYDIEDIRVSSRDIKNLNYFDDKSKGYDGILIEDSIIDIEKGQFYLFVFRKGSNEANRARQIHGFRYEGEIKNLNKLIKLPYVDKWDAKGPLTKSFLKNRIDKNIEFFNGSTTKSLKKVENNIESIDMSILPNDYSRNLFWNIKCIQSGNSIEMGDFKRISGLKKVDSNVELKEDYSVKFFMLNIGLHDKEKNIVKEYFIFMSIAKWKEYLPDFKNKEVMTEIKSMYKDLAFHKLNGERSEDSENLWKSYTNRYTNITSDKVIKIRFKRDSKGQLRIQSSINYSSFVSEILKNPHIIIY